MKVTSSSGIFKYIYYMGVIFCYLERENIKALQFYVNNSSYFEICSSLLQVWSSNKHCTLELRNQISAGSVY